MGNACFFFLFPPPPIPLYKKPLPHLLPSGQNMHGGLCYKSLKIHLSLHSDRPTLHGFSLGLFAITLMFQVFALFFFHFNYLSAWKRHNVKTARGFNTESSFTPFYFLCSRGVAGDHWICIYNLMSIKDVNILYCQTLPSQVPLTGHFAHTSPQLFATINNKTSWDV